MTDSPNRPGPLDGLTILRFAHAYDSGGGTERYLDDLDGILLQRSAATIIRLHLTQVATAPPVVERAMGRGRLISQALPVHPGRNPEANHGVQTLRFYFKQWVRNHLLYHPLMWRLYGESKMRKFVLAPQPGQAVDAGSSARQWFQSLPVDLVMMHYFGGSDADAVIKECRFARIPFAVLNHYSNDRFLHFAIRKHVSLAQGVAGVNGLDLPDYIRKDFSNLSDGIDTDYFQTRNARPLASQPRLPIILLPARVVREKGQLDLVRAVESLGPAGTGCCIAFAGRVDSSDYVDELRDVINTAGMSSRVFFLGNLDMAELRDWYAACSIVAFPTYHHEGLGRVIVEAQAMERPVIAYATGGVSEGIEEGISGYLLPTGSVAGLAAQLCELLASPPLREAMGKCGRIHAEKRFSLPALAQRHEMFYSHIIMRNKSARNCGAET